VQLEPQQFVDDVPVCVKWVDERRPIAANTRTGVSYQEADAKNRTG